MRMSDWSSDVCSSDLWKSARRPDWDWFETGLAYDNARLAEALIRAGRRLPSLPNEEAGLAALDWLCDRQTAAAGHFRPMGSEGFGCEGEYRPFDQIGQQSGRERGCHSG